MSMSLIRRSGNGFQIPGDAPLSTAPIIGVCIAPALYLPYTFLYIRLWMLRRRQKSGEKVVTLALAILFFLTTLALILNIQDVVDAWVFHSENPLAYFYRPTNRVIVAQTLCMLFTNIIATSILVWRLYIVWERNKFIVIFPILTELADTGVVISVCVYQTRLLENPFKYFKTASDVMTAYFSLTITQYILVTSLIIGKLLWKQRKMEQKGNTSYKIGRRLIQMSLESGLISALAVILYGVVWYKGLIGWLYIAESLEPIIISAVPTFIVYRLHLVVADTAGKTESQNSLRSPHHYPFANSSAVAESPHHGQLTPRKWAMQHDVNRLDLVATVESSHRNAFEQHSGQTPKPNTPRTDMRFWTVEHLNAKPLPPRPIERPRDMEEGYSIYE